MRPLPRSLANIYTELRDRPRASSRREHGDLTAWADQGVMLLNRVLTVRPGESASHRGRAGRRSPSARSTALAAPRRARCAAILWGADARTLKPMLGAVPWVSPRTPRRCRRTAGFFGSRPFSRVNALLVDQGAAAGRLDAPDGIKLKIEIIE